MKIGGIDINKVKIGSTDINKVYIGSEQVWSNEVSSLLLDNLSGSTGAFSLRKLKSSYSGNAIQVRRASDNTTQDIGFLNNQLDTTTLNTFCSGTDGFVSIWYNQSDINNNAIQTTSANQPKIYDSLTGIELENGKPTLLFNITSNGVRKLFVNNNNYGNINQILSTFIVNKSTSSATQMVTSKGYLHEGGHMIYYRSSKYKTVIEFDILTTIDTAINSQNLMSLFSAVGSNGFNQFKNGSLINQSTLTVDLIGSNSKNYGIGYNTHTGSYSFVGNIQEIITFDNNLLSDRLTIENDINTNYTIY